MAVVEIEGTADEVASPRLEDQLLNAIKSTQDISLQFMSFWFDSAAKLVTAIAEAPKPVLPDPPKPEQIVEFTRNLVANQQRYVKNLVARKDPVSFLSSLGEAGMALMKKPAEVAAANMRLMLGTGAAIRATAQCALGKTPTSPVTPPVGDKRFADRAFAENPLFFFLEQEYLLGCQLVNELLDAAELDEVHDAKARFAAQFILDALAPTNTLLGNPAALKEAFDTGGKSLVRGAKNMLKDFRLHKGWPSQVDASGFMVGINMAATPGAVVYRNELIELIQYDAQTELVHEVPLLFCPPWINKYYIMDLAPGKSLIEWAIQHGHTCFAISYRNPDSSMADLSFEDYLRLGPLDAVKVIREITGAPEVNTVSLCLGGTLSAIALAYNADIGDTSIKTATLLNTNTDFSVPGVLGVFTDEATVAGLEKSMAAEGYLEGDSMAHVFDTLRANDLIFQYVGNNWLLGHQPPAFDLLVWNKDSTRMPARMHSEYLRSCYLKNAFVKGELEIGGRALDPKRVAIDTYVVSAVNDHIVPWHSGYKTAQAFSGPNRFVLSTSGHIAGVVNPPSPKAKFWSNDARPADPQEWKNAAELKENTWWEDWSLWIGERSGGDVAAPKKLGSRDHPVLEAAPGSYVRAH
ncbi:MAG: alpha/beta fold hydrolase [Acidimicrobiales bacterium]|jgi:polyhydroxyalkanoate synthase